MTCRLGMTGCSPSCGHRAVVDSYRQEVQRHETVAEAATGGYEQETRDWFRDHPLPQFKDWLTGLRETRQTARDALDGGWAGNPAANPAAGLSARLQRTGAER